MVSNNLLTPTNTPDRTELTARDRAALAALDAWLTDAFFLELQANLQAVRGRLKTFFEQASAPAR